MAMIQDHYYVNVAQRYAISAFNGEPTYMHWCRVELGSTLEDAAKLLADDVRKRFPEPEYKCTLYKVVCRGEVVDF